MKILTIFKQTLKKNPMLFLIIRLLLTWVLKGITRLVPLDEKLILYNSYGGLNQNDSPKVLYDAIKKDPAFCGYRHIWATSSDQRDVCNTFATVRIDTLKYFFVAMRSKFWIANVNIERGLTFKKKEQIFINTWHSVPLKRMGNAVRGRSDYDFSNVDYLIYSGEYEKKIFLKDFLADPSSLKLSLMPRNDPLVSNHVDTEIIKRKLNLSKHKKIILFAPTWREADLKQTHDQISIDIDKWEQKLGAEYVLFFRSHHFAKFNLDPKHCNFVFDVSNYHNITELLLISDILVSDYSSIFFDFSLTGKPMYCFAKDFESFSTERGFYVDLKTEIPNGLITEEDDLLSKIQNCNMELQSILTKEFCSKFIETRRLGTKKCVEFLRDKI